MPANSEHCEKPLRKKCQSASSFAAPQPLSAPTSSFDLWEVHHAAWVGIALPRSKSAAASFLSA
jgi:hypothetical protein